MQQHVDPDDLALLAMGEHATTADDAHVLGCLHCQTELDQLRAVVSSARLVTPEDRPQQAPAHVWDAVVAELGLRATAADASGDPGPAVVSLAAFSRRRVSMLAAAAAVIGLALGVGGTLLATRTGSRPPVQARALMTVLASSSRGGDAEVLRTSAGRVLELDVPTLHRASGYYEVWLLDRDGKRLVAIGLLDLAAGHRARFPLPPGLDLAAYPVVDVSLEPADGNPAHSGDSIVRGTLTS